MRRTLRTPLALTGTTVATALAGFVGAQQALVPSGPNKLAFPEVVQVYRNS
jgi:hypothetical protein